MVRKWDYGELECEILEKYLTFSDMMTASVIMIEDEERQENEDPTEENSESNSYMVMIISDEIEHISGADLKMIELELNLYSLSDSLENIDKMKTDIELKAEEALKDVKKGTSMSLLVTILYMQEVWVNVAKTITIVEEEVQSLMELSAQGLQVLIDSTRKDMIMLQKCLEFVEAKTKEAFNLDDDEEISEEKAKGVKGMKIPTWLQTTDIDFDEIKRDIETYQIDKQIESDTKFIDSFA